MSNIKASLFAVGIILLCLDIIAAAPQDNGIKPVLFALRDNVKFSAQVHYINQNLPDVLPILNSKDLITVIKRYCDLVELHEDIFLATYRDTVSGFARAIAAIADPADLAEAHASLVKLQEKIRGLPEFYEKQEKRNTLIKGNFLQIAEAFCEGSFAEKVSILFELVPELGDEDKRFYKKNIFILSSMLLDYAYYLSRVDLDRLMYVFAELGDQKRFIYIIRLLNELAELSQEESSLSTQELEKVKKFKEAAKSTTAFKPKPIPDKSLRKVELWKTKVEKKVFKIGMPINDGLGKVASLLAAYLGLNDKERERLQIPLLMFARLTVRKSLQPGDVLYKEGEKGGSFALILSGKLSVLSDKGNGEYQELAILIGGESVGELSLFGEDAKRCATVRAKSATELFEITEKSLDDFGNQIILQRIFEQLLKKADDGLNKLNREQLDRSPIGESFANEKFKPKIIKAGTILVKAGEKHETLIWVQKGVLNLVREKIVGQIGAGEIYDEITFLTTNGKYRHSLQAPAGSDCEIIKITRNKFEALQKEPNAIWQMSKVLSEIIQYNNAKLKDTPAYRLQLACEGKLNFKFVEWSKVDIDAPCPITFNLPGDSKPIHVAAKHNNYSALHELLERGANKDAIDENGNTAAHIIALEDNSSYLVELLTDYSANFDITNHRNKTPWQIANERNNKVLEKQLPAPETIEASSCYHLDCSLISPRSGPPTTTTTTTTTTTITRTNSGLGDTSSKR